MRISRKRCILSTPCLVLGKGFRVGGSNGAISGSIISKMAADGHLGITALSRVTLASAELFCFSFGDRAACGETSRSAEENKNYRDRIFHIFCQKPCQSGAVATVEATDATASVKFGFWENWKTIAP